MSFSRSNCRSELAHPLLLFLHRPKMDRRRDWPCALRFRRRTHDRQPANLSRTRSDQSLRRISSGRWRAALGGAPRLARDAHSACRFHDQTADRNSLTRFCSSSIGRKWIVAVTGLVLFGFVVGHMIGNLQIFLGPEAINRYGAFLQGAGELLWVVRLALLAMLILHVVFTIKLQIGTRSPAFALPPSAENGSSP